MRQNRRLTGRAAGKASARVEAADAVAVAAADGMTIAVMRASHASPAGNLRLINERRLANLPTCKSKGRTGNYLCHEAVQHSTSAKRNKRDGRSSRTKPSAGSSESKHQLRTAAMI